MAAIVVTKVVDNWLPLPKSSPQRISMAVWPTGLGNAEDARKAQQQLLGQPDFIVEGTTDTSDADSDAINLSDQGVTFPDGTQRTLYVEASVADNDGQGLIIGRAVIDGGATPIVSDESVDGTLDDGLAGAPSLDFEVVSNEVIIEAVGITDVDCRWVIRVWVSDAIPLAYIATT